MARPKIDKKPLVLKVAKKMFSDYGYKKTVIDDIVREAGIAKGTFYQYFKGKEELFLAVIEDMRGEVMENYLAHVSKAKSEADQIEQTLRFSLTSMDSNPLFAKVTNADEELAIALSSLDDDAVKQMREESIKGFRLLFEQAISAGDLRDNMNLESIPIVFGMLKLMHFFKDAANKLGIDNSTYNEAVIDIAMNGILKR